MCEFHESTCNGFGDIWWTDNPIYFSSIDVIMIIHPLVLEGESEKWRIFYIIAASGSGVKTLQALYTISSSFGPLA